MKIIMLSTDQNVFKEGSEVRQRMIEYGSLAEELHIVIYSQSQSVSLREISRRETNRKAQIGKNVFVYPTNTRFKPFYFWDAYKIGTTIIRNWKLEIRNSRDKILVTSQDPFETGLVGYWLKKKFGIPLQIQIHTDFLSPYFWQESLKNKIRVLLGKWLVKRADCLRVVSQRIKDSLAASFPMLSYMIAVIPIFIDVEKIQNSSIKTDLHKKYPDYDFIILMASRLTKEKNIFMALQAMRGLTRTLIANQRRNFSAKSVSSQRKSALLLIVGDGPELNNLKAKNLKLKTNVVFEPWTDDLVSYYKTADLFLNTSNYEGYGRTIIEALAAGCPVISTDVGIALEFIKAGQSGIVIAPKDARALSGALIEIISNKAKYKETIEQPIIKDKSEYLRLYKESFLLCTTTKNSSRKN